MASDQFFNYQPMSDLEKNDLLYNVITKLTVVSDFMQTIDDTRICIRELTPSGLELILCECIAALKKIGGFQQWPNEE